jgi:hypothetical protein
MKKVLLIMTFISSFIPVIGQIGKEVYSEVELTDLYESPQKYDKQKIKVTGYFVHQFEGAAIYVNQAHWIYNPDEKNRAFWVDFSPEIMSHKDPDKFSGVYVKIAGTFNMNEHGQMGLYGGAIMNVISIDSVEIK